MLFPSCTIVVREWISQSPLGTSVVLNDGTGPSGGWMMHARIIGRALSADEMALIYAREEGAF